jgi:hypothetical protein
MGSRRIFQLAVVALLEPAPAPAPAPAPTPFVALIIAECDLDVWPRKGTGVVDFTLILE